MAAWAREDMTREEVARRRRRWESGKEVAETREDGRTTQIVRRGRCEEVTRWRGGKEEKVGRRLKLE